MKSQEIYKIYESLPENLKKKIDDAVKKFNLSEDKKDKLILRVYEEYIKSLVEPNESIGILAAQCISEPATQATMRVYHLAGTVGLKITLGLPRLIELFDARKEISSPSMTIYLKNEYNTEEKAHEIANEIIEKKLEDLASVVINLSEFTLEVIPYDKNDFEELYKKLKEKIKSCECEKSRGKIVLVPKKEYEFKELRILRDRIIKTPIRGIKGIEAAIVTKDGNRWVIQTQGSNLKEVIRYPWVDITHTYSNNPHEVKEVFGIEAARNLLILEIYRTLQQQGLDVNIRFLSLIVDTMCFSGDIMPIGRYGVAGRKVSILARAGFEETTKHLIEAGIKNLRDEFRGMFENVMVGNVAPIGTGRVEVGLKHGKDK
ncbi:MAG: DNA-directed RNA polymerase subunit A'' [Candidatus Aenigmatarchaeota archaeon]